MRRGSAVDGKAKRAEANTANPRYAPFARLLARDLVDREELDRSARKAYSGPTKPSDDAGEPQ
jgi:hypothetical protein